MNQQNIVLEFLGSDGFELGYEYYAIEEGDISSLTAWFSHKFLEMY